MPVIQHHQLSKRIESGSTFSITFGIIAAIVVIICAVWGIAIPEYRRTHPPSPTKKKWNDGTILTKRKRNKLKRGYPNHPTVRPLLSKPSTAQVLPTYDPRTESPFPAGSALSMVNLCSRSDTQTHPTSLPAMSISSNGLFTPLKNGGSEDDESNCKFHTVPRARDSRHLETKSIDFGDAKDFILAVPEPLAFKPRDAGRPFAVARHMERYGPTYTMSPASSDKLLHPNKLFRVVQKADLRSSSCSGTSMRVDHRQSDTVMNPPIKDEVNMVEFMNGEDKTIINDGTHEQFSLLETIESLPPPNKSLANIHRLRSYQTLTGGQESKLSRSGTLTRPKTPVDELRKLYTQQKNITVPTIHIPHTGTASTLFTSTDAGSDFGSVSTPATSPAFPPINMNLLPTPLCLKRSFEPGSVRDSGITHHLTLGSTSFGEGSSDDTSPVTDTNDQECIGKNGRGFYHTGRRLTKPPPLNIKHDTKISPLNTSSSRRSITEFSHAVFGPLINSNTMRSRVRASSLYSRDTHGISMTNTPITPDFPTPVSEAFTDHSAVGNPFKTQDSVKARINEWTQRIGGNNVPPLPAIRHASPMFESSNTLIEEMSDTTDTKNIDTMVKPSIGDELMSSIGDQNVKQEEDDAPGRAAWI